jgi:hypothetical protein
MKSAKSIELFCEDSVVGLELMAMQGTWRHVGSRMMSSKALP